ncbi:uncharacterized protein LOC144138109 isoform X3 [Haemaphysalis longicornis]
MALSRPCSGIVQTLHKICYKGINVQCTLWAGLPSTSLASVSRHHVQLGCLALWHCPDPAQDLLQVQAAGPTLVLLIWMMDAWAGLRTGKQYLQKWQGRTDRFLFGETLLRLTTSKRCAVQAAGPTLVLLIWMMDAWAGLRTGKQYLQKWQGRTDRFLFGETLFRLTSSKRCGVQAAGPTLVLLIWMMDAWAGLRTGKQYLQKWQGRTDRFLFGETLFRLTTSQRCAVQAAGPTLVPLLWMMDAWAGLRTGKQYLQKWQGRTDRFLFGASCWSDLGASHLDDGCLGWPEDRKAVFAQMARQN